MSGRGKGGKVPCFLFWSLAFLVNIDFRDSERVEPSVTAKFFATIFRVCDSILVQPWGPLTVVQVSQSPLSGVLLVEVV